MAVREQTPDYQQKGETLVDVIFKAVLNGAFHNITFPSLQLTVMLNLFQYSKHKLS